MNNIMKRWYLQSLGDLEAIVSNNQDKFKELFLEFSIDFSIINKGFLISNSRYFQKN